jgi:eukaryotic-like serine/threonine-protein kinase
MRFGPGAHIGPFEILAQVGAGGMGEVYRARDTRLDRIVALKFLASDALTAERVERFKREARAVSRLTHPNICALYDIGEQNGSTFLVMEYIHGETLADRVERGRLRLDEVVRIGIQIADALDAAHREGVVHRDLKPANIILTRDGVKLLDFGLAKLRPANEDQEGEALTASMPVSEEQVVVGTLPYMSPEQLEGRPVDARTDIFALGAVLYEMVAGKRPFRANSRASTIAAILNETPAPLQNHEPSTPLNLQRLIGRCLEKDREHRWQSAGDLAAALRWIAEDSPRSGLSGRAPLRNQRSIMVWSSMAVLAAAAAVAATMAITRTAAAVATYTPVTFRRGAVSGARFTPDGQNVVYSASWEGAPYDVFLAREGSADARSLGLTDGRILSISPVSDLAVLFGQQNITDVFGQPVLARIPLAGGTRRDLLEGVIEADWIPNTDELAVVRIGQTDGRAVVEFPAGTKVYEASAVWSLRVSPDGRRVAFFEGPTRLARAPGGMVTVIDRGGTRSTLTRGWFGFGLAWSPSGSEIWFSATHGGRAPSLWAVSLSGKERPIQATPEWLVLHDVFHDGRVLLASNSIQSGISCQPAGETQERDLTWLGGAAVRDMSPDGRMVIFAERLFGAAGGIPVAFRRGLDGSPAIRLGVGDPIALSPDRKWVLTQVRDEWVLLPTGAGAIRSLPKGPLRKISTGTWLPDGHRIAFTGSEREQGGAWRIYVQDVDDGSVRALTPEGVSLAPQAGYVAGSVLGLSASGWSLYPVDGGHARPVPALKPQDDPVRLSADAQSIYAITGGEMPPSASRKVFRIELATGARTVWKTLTPPDPVGLDRIGPVVMTSDGRSYCYTYLRRLGTLFVVDGLK